MTADSCECASTRLPKVAVIGGGFAGIRAIKALRRSKCSITLYEPRKHLAMLPALPDLAGGWIEPKQINTPISPLLPANVRHVEQFVTSIQLENKTVTADEWTEDFDYILITSGAKSYPCPFDTPERRAHTLDSVAAAVRLRDDFAAYMDSAQNPHLVVAGGGYTGLELAMSLSARAHRMRKDCRITIVEKSPKIMAFLPEKRLEYLKKALSQAGVEIRTSSEIGSWDGVNLVVGDETLEDVFFCWTVGSRFTIEVEGAPERLPDGRLRVGEGLSLVEHPDVFVAGDAAAFDTVDGPLRKAVNFAWYGGYAAGRNMAACLRGRRIRDFKPVDLGWVVPLHSTAVGHILGVLWIRGRFSLRLHYLMCGMRSMSLANLLRFVRNACTLF